MEGNHFFSVRSGVPVSGTFGGDFGRILEQRLRSPVDSNGEDCMSFWGEFAFARNYFSLHGRICIIKFCATYGTFFTFFQKSSHFRREISSRAGK